MKQRSRAGLARRRIALAGFAVAAAVLVAPLAEAGGAEAGGSTFIAELDPAASDPSTFADVAGGGRVSAELSGDQLTLTGAFQGLPSPATAAQLRSGLATGVPGPVIATVTTEKATSGAISGIVRLSRAQTEALRRGAVYLQINSIKAPDGNLWGWLLRPRQTQ